MYVKIKEHRSVLKNALILGDWNCVSRACDRLPPREDDATVVDMMELILANLGVEDGWAKANPNEIDFYIYARKRWTQPTGCITIKDRSNIYSKEDMESSTTDWKIIRLPETVSDHDMATVLLSPENLPNLEQEHGG
ncbi:hypothetical protein IW261DRAFT_1351598 [Armillaria novae-zelandiae]|uniref:Endonuclease/exonuclease/phosphatase domain-containing protein n=1 Tax=Armillaria novae-zelandiae TaxID=153914 RepID=A0AA39KI83_9AGAR|nr:hypothetical protein IW261DRAFT_1351598 [Armillaria novae-zelandiae]